MRVLYIKVVSPILISGYKLGDLIDSFVNEILITDKDMYGGKVACISCLYTHRVWFKLIEH